MNTRATLDVLSDVFAERVKQHHRWGANDWPDGTGGAGAADDLASARLAYDQAFRSGGAWLAILAEEFAEVAAETSRDELRAELVQVAAVAVQWVEAIDRRGTP